MDKITEMFWQRVVIKDGCWEWLGNTSPKGYPRIHHKRKTIPCHRFSYILHKGTIPDGFCVCHSCDNPSCVNPDHLWAGTHKQNQQDCTKKGRRAYGSRNGKHTRPDKIKRGEANPRSRLTEQQVRDIRKLGGTISQQKIADIFNTPQTNVSNILRGVTWRHILP